MHKFFFGEEIYLIKDKDRAHAVGLAGSEETIDEGSGGNRMVNRDDERHLVDVRSEDMTLFA